MFAILFYCASVNGGADRIRGAFAGLELQKKGGLFKVRRCIIQGIKKAKAQKE